LFIFFQRKLGQIDRKQICDKYGQNQELWKNIKLFCDIADGQILWVKKAYEKFIKEHA